MGQKKLKISKAVVTPKIKLIPKQMFIIKFLKLWYLKMLGQVEIAKEQDLQQFWEKLDKEKW